MKVAVISGVTGQDGSYLAELLLSKGYFVIGFSDYLGNSKARSKTFIKIPFYV